MTASGCCSRRVWRAASSSVIWRLVSAMILTSDPTVAPYASATAGGALRWAPRRPCCIWWAALSRVRRRPAALSAARIWGNVRQAPRLGVGALPRIARVSRPARSEKVSSAAG